MNKKPLVIYHANCADGFGAAWCFHHKELLANRDIYDYHPGVYTDPPPDVAGRTVFLVDFSYKLEVVEKMLETADKIVLIDHHKTAIENLQPLITANKIVSYVDTENSGAMLAWHYLFDKEPPQLLKHIEDRDLWKFKLHGTREIQSALFSFPYDFGIWDTLMMEDQSISRLLSDGVAIERKHHKDIEELLKVVTRLGVIAGHTVPVANLPYIYSSDAGHKLAEGFPFAACYWDTPKGRTFSLRSTEAGADVSEIAVKFGGGGHKHAAGFTVSENSPLIDLQVQQK